MRNHKENFAAQKRSFTCLASLCVQDDRLVWRTIRREQVPALRDCKNVEGCAMPCSNEQSKTPVPTKNELGKDYVFTRW